MGHTKEFTEYLVPPFDDQCSIMKSLLMFSADSLCVHRKLMAIGLEILIEAGVNPTV